MSSSSANDNNSNSSSSNRTSSSSTSSSNSSSSALFNGRLRLPLHLPMHLYMHLHLRLHLRRRLRLTAFCGPLAGMVKVSRITNNSANTTIVHHDALVVLHIQSRCISRELRSRVLTADIPTRRQDNGRGPLGHRAHASSPPALGRALLACPGNQQPTAASRQRTPGTRGGPHVRRA